MAFTWHGTARTEAVVNLGPLALIQPLLDQLDIAGIIDRHLPPDPQLEFSHGQVLSLLLAARLCQPTALINLPAWAERTGADILWNLPADKLKEDAILGPRCNRRRNSQPTRNPVGTEASGASPVPGSGLQDHD